MRGNLHEIVVLLEHGDERGPARAEDFGGEGFFLSGRRGVLVAPRQLRELLVERQELAGFACQRDAEARERLGHRIAVFSCRRHLLIKAREERNDTVNARTRERKDAAELRGLRARRVEALRQAIDVLASLHRVVRDVKKPRARRADGEERRRLGGKQGEAAGKARDAALGGIKSHRDFLAHRAARHASCFHLRRELPQLRLELCDFLLLSQEVRRRVARVRAVGICLLRRLEDIREDFLFLALDVELTVDGLVLHLQPVELSARALELREVDVGFELQLIVLRVEARDGFRHRFSRRVEIELQPGDVESQADVELVDFLSFCHVTSHRR